MLIVALIPALLISLAFSFFVLNQRHNIAEAALLDRGALLTRQLAPAAEYGAFSGNRQELLRLAESVAREADVTAVTLYDANGHTLVSLGTRRSILRQLSFRDKGLERSEDEQTLFFHRKILKSRLPIEDISHTENNMDTDTGTGTDTNIKSGSSQVLGSVTVEMSRNSVSRAMQETLIVTAVFSLLAVAIGSWLARRLSQEITKPILALQQTVALIKKGHLDERVTPHPKGVLRDLEEGFNDMTAALESGRDLLERRINEATAELRDKKEEAERTSLAKTRFLAAASHDLRQPLHALMLFTDKLDQCSDISTQHQLLKLIQTATEAMNQQLNALLDISRLDLGDLAIDLQVVALDPMIERLVAIHAPDAHAKGVRLTRVPTRRYTLTDPRLLESMVGNLIANAVRYTHQGGIVVGVRHRGQHLRLEVWDSGIGMPHNQLQLIFQEFYQVTNPERNAEKGLGLGLSIVARLAERLHHPVDVRSIHGRGSVFGITLPAVMPKPAPGDAPESESESESKSESGPRFVEQTYSSKEYYPLSKLHKSVVILGKSPEKGDEPCICDLVESWGCQVFCADHIHALDRSSMVCPDALIFPAEEWEDVRQYALRQTSHPVLIMVGTPPAPTPMDPSDPSDPSHPSSQRRAHTGFEGPATHPHAPSYDHLALPIRPARLRALLQTLLQPPPEIPHEETTV